MDLQPVRYFQHLLKKRKKKKEKRKKKKEKRKKKKRKPTQDFDQECFKYIGDNVEFFLGIRLRSL